ncbi:MAG: glutamate-1-semialdehyde 2,1-aminomutase [Lentisphaerae bacterium]|nr:glutamate-1-semialdehyde 2,1-aminomutase [Lentisphaerota bacterium]
MSAFPQVRLRRLRRTPSLRRIFDAPLPGPEKFIWPVFVVEGQRRREPIEAMPGQSRLSVDLLKAELDRVVRMGIGSILVFGVTEEKDKDATGEAAYHENGIVQNALRELRRAFPELVIFTDVCLCAYTRHGHCGPLTVSGDVDNDQANAILAKVALSHAAAGADVVAPSAMMDGQVQAIRAVLDAAGATRTLIMSYSSKFASALYGPFREAEKSAPQSGDRRGYQAPNRDSRQALRCAPPPTCPLPLTMSAESMPCSLPPPSGVGATCEKWRGKPRRRLCAPAPTSSFPTGPTATTKSLGNADRNMDSQALFERACQVIPGGVNSPVRAFKAVGGNPVYIASGQGAHLTTVEGRELVDFCGSWGPLILGHARKEVVEAVCQAALQGTSFGANTPREVEFAECLCEMVPYLEMVRLVSSGTEAVMTALRLARGWTGRNKIIKFDGCYHGHADGMLVAAGSGLLTGGITSSAGVPPAVAADTIVLAYNDLSAVREIAGRVGEELAAIIVEPVAANMGLVLPASGFLEGLREVASRCGALLIFDEVITGFRFAATTYGALCGVTPDLTCLGKIIGGGLPIGAVGGSKEIMERLAPLGPVYQAGTLSGNPVAVAAGLATLRLLKTENHYPALDRLGAQLAAGLNIAAHENGIKLHCAHLGGVFTPFFCEDAPTDLSGVKRCDTNKYAAFFRAMLEHGFYLPPSQFEVGFVSAAHSDAVIKGFLVAADETLVEMSSSYKSS